jgi:hypothetical protein
VDYAIIGGYIKCADDYMGVFVRVLVGCEESGVVRRAFRERGHDAWSNDLIPSRDSSPHHLQKCVRKAIVDDSPWDIIILHPDCTKLSLSGNRWYGRGTAGESERTEAIAWTIDLWKLANGYTTVGCALENPTSVIWQYIGKPDYYQPHDFGHGETKKTGILVHNLPKLMPTNKVGGREQRIWRMAPGPNRKRDRSETFQGLADAMAEQWGCL